MSQLVCGGESKTQDKSWLMTYSCCVMYMFCLDFNILKGLNNNMNKNYNADVMGFILAG